MSVALTELAVGLDVDIEPRTWPGINKHGGCGSIVKIHYVEDVPIKVDIKYHLGGGEKEVELTYVKKHEELERRGRSRRINVKMNVDTLGGKPTHKKKGANQKQKKERGKRKALSDIDFKNGKSAKKTTEGSIEVSSEMRADVAAEIVATACSDKIVAVGQWRIIQDGKFTDYVNTLTKGRRIAYWWSEEDSWLEGTICKSLSKSVTTSIIKWTIRVDFDNGDVHTLVFHPNEKRWKAFYPRTATATKKPAPNKSDVPKEEPKAATGEMTKAARKPKVGKSTKSQAMKIASKPLPQDMKISFGPELSYKLKQMSTKICSAKASSTDDVRANQSSSKIVTKKVSTKGSAASYPTKTAANCKTATATGFAQKSEEPPESKLKPHEVYRSEGSLKYASNMNGTGQSVGQGLYKSECDKAGQFVDYMVPKTASSPSSDSSVGDLELKLNHGRMQLFNSILHEVMFKKNLDTIDVDEMLLKINAYQEAKVLMNTYEPSESDRNNSMKPFSMLEIKPFLQKLHDSNKLFMDEDEGKVYAL